MTGEELPRAHVRRRRLFRLSWVIPLVAAIIAGWLVYEHLQRQGPEITVRFDDVTGLRVGQTPVKYRGVQVGVVLDMGLSQDRKQALVRIRLHNSASGIAREGARFWIVRPRVRMVTDHRSVQDVQIIAETQSLNASDVLPGLQIPLAKIFE